MFRDGFKYWLVYEKGDKKYYRCCKYKKQNCGGKIIIVHGKVLEKSAHNHSKDANEALIEKFRKSLTQRAMSEDTDLQQIYFEVSSVHVEASLIYPYSKAESTMRKSRKCKKSVSSNGINTVAEFFKSNSLPRDSLQQKTIDNQENGSTITIMFDRRTIEALETITELHIDSTLTFHSLQIHLLIIHGVKNQISLPIIFGVLNYKTENAYVSIFEYIKEQFPHNIAPTTILTNCDDLIQNAIRISFSDASIKLFWFHYVQHIVDSIGPKCEEHRKGFVNSGLKMLLVLPLLPGNYINPGFEAVKKWIIEKESNTQFFKILCVQVEKLINLNGAEKLSIFGLPHCMSLPHFNTNLKSSIKKDDISLTEILNVITKISSKNLVKLKANLSKEKAKQMLIINNATAQWIKGSIILRRPLQFLQLCSHAISDSMISNLINAKNLEDWGESDMSDRPAQSITAEINEISNSNPGPSSTTHHPPFSTEPPPLIFYPKNNIRLIRKVVTNSEPPPLIFLKKQ